MSNYNSSMGGEETDWEVQIELLVVELPKAFYGKDGM